VVLHFKLHQWLDFFTLVSFRDGTDAKMNFIRLQTLITVHKFILLMQSGPIGVIVFNK